jgi:hypothetical protein
MLGRNSYSQAEIDRAKTNIAKALKRYRAVARSASGAAKELADFEAPLFNKLALALDRPFVHRVRNVTGKDGNALKELELICDALIDNDGVFQTN